MVRPLTKYESYTRIEVHDIFSPQTAFTLGAGSWGLHGIVRVPGRPNDFAFFVTYGRKQGDYRFDENITKDGILTWQSQPKQNFGNPTIKQLINHNHLEGNIYLFLRTATGSPYTYLGRLAYVEHDSEREQPASIKWQILDWELSSERAQEIGLQYVKPKGIGDIGDRVNQANFRLIETLPHILREMELGMILSRLPPKVK